MIAAGVGVFAALAVAIVAQLVAGRPSRDRRVASRRLREVGGEAADPDGDPESSAGAFARQKDQKDWALPKGDDRPDPLRTKLAMVGYRSPSAPATFSAVRLGLTLALGFGAGGGAKWAGLSVAGAVTAGATAAAVGFLAPSMALASKVKRRQRAIRNALPDALDVMVLAVEGGASLNAAIAWVTDEAETISPALQEEMTTVQSEIQLGLSAGAAVTGFADRCDLAEVRDLAAALVQSERYGASVAKALRAYSDTARQERQMWSEEVAQKAAVKIMFPMLVCIFPAMFIVLLGPAAFQLMKLFGK